MTLSCVVANDTLSVLLSCFPCGEYRKSTYLSAKRSPLLTNDHSSFHFTYLGMMCINGAIDQGDILYQRKWVKKISCENNNINW